MEEGAGSELYFLYSIASPALTLVGYSPTLLQIVSHPTSYPQFNFKICLRVFWSFIGGSRILRGWNCARNNKLAGLRSADASNWPVCENLKMNVQNLSSELNNPQQAQQLREEDDQNGKASCQVACDWWVTPCWPITDMVSLLLLDTPLYS